MNGIKKAITVLLAATLLMSAVPVSAEKTEAPDAPAPELKVYDANTYGIANTNVSEKGSIPSAYSAVDEGVVTAPKIQGQIGTCWTFAAASMAETSLISQGQTYGGGKTADADTVDLSEAQIAYFTYRNAYDPLGNLDGDGTAFLGEDWLNCGGNHLFSTLSFASWKGLCEDKEMPYSSLSLDSEYDVTFSYKAAARLENAYWINMSETETVKSLIMEYGTVLSDYAHYDIFLEEETGSYYCPDTYVTNHAITIVGWDDNYSRENFKNTPEYDGAWLVKNSWGSDWGSGGYGWISYCDVSLSASGAVCMLFTDAEKYDNNYQYDGSCVIASLQLPSGMMLANTYTASASDKERIEAVSFGLLSANVDYSIQIYKNCRDSRYMDGEALLSEPVSGSTAYAGYYTVELPEDIIVSRGDRYTVCITYHSKTEDYVEPLIDYSAVDGSGMFSFINNTENDRSYCGQRYGVSPSGMYFFDLVDNNGCTARIKALTSSLTADGEDIAPEPTAPDTTVSDTTISDTDTDDDSSVTESETTEPDHKTEYTVIVNGIEYKAEEGATLKLYAPFYVDEDNFAHRFMYWICSADGIVSDLNSSEAYLTVPAADVQITARYYKVGDTDQDGTIAMTDVLRMCSVIRGNSKDPEKLCDIDNDGETAATDILCLLSLIKGIYIPES